MGCLGGSTMGQGAGGHVGTGVCTHWGCARGTEGWEEPGLHEFGHVEKKEHAGGLAGAGGASSLWMCCMCTSIGVWP